MDRAVFSSLLADRRAAACICGAAALHLGCIAVGLPGWRCPLLSTTGVPCPGCGLSRAMLALVRGDAAGALALHAFAPVAMVAAGLLLAAVLSGAERRVRLAEAVRRIESRTGATAWLLAGLLIYWALRLVLDWPSPAVANN